MREENSRKQPITARQHSYTELRADYGGLPFSLGRCEKQAQAAGMPLRAFVERKLTLMNQAWWLQYGKERTNG